MIRKEVKIINKLGLHARAAAKFVKLATTFESLIEIEKAGRKINGKSIMGIMLLAAAQGQHIVLIIQGDDEQQAIIALEKLISERFNEEE